MSPWAVTSERFFYVTAPNGWSNGLRHIRAPGGELVLSLSINFGVPKFAGMYECSIYLPSDDDDCEREILVDFGSYLHPLMRYLNRKELKPGDLEKLTPIIAHLNEIRMKFPIAPKGKRP